MGEFVNRRRLVGGVAKAARGISGGVGAGAKAAGCRVCAAARATNSAAATLISRQQRMVELEQQVATLNYLRTYVLYNVHIFIYLWDHDPRKCGEGGRGGERVLGTGEAKGVHITVRGNKVRRGFHILGVQHWLSQRHRQSEREREKERERERERAREKHLCGQYVSASAVP